MAVNRLHLKSFDLNASKMALSLTQVVFILALSVLVIVIESQHLHTPDEKKEDVHEVHPILKERLTPGEKCWKTEPFEIVEECDRCTEEELRNSDPLVCVAAARKELVECKESQKKVYRSCDRVTWIEERDFWTFEGVVSFLGLVSGLAVFVRQKQLDHRMYQRIQKQIAAGV